FQRRPGMKFPFQVVGQDAALGWEETDLSLSDALETKPAFDLTAGPLLQATLVSLAVGRNVLILRAPTLCVDTATLANVVAEFRLLHNGFDPPEALQYAD